MNLSGTLTSAWFKTMSTFFNLMKPNKIINNKKRTQTKLPVFGTFIYVSMRVKLNQRCSKRDFGIE